MIMSWMVVKDIKVQSTGTDISTVILATDPKNDLALLKASHTAEYIFFHKQ